MPVAAAEHPQRPERDNREGAEDECERNDNPESLHDASLRPLRIVYVRLVHIGRNPHGPSGRSLIFAAEGDWHGDGPLPGLGPIGVRTDPACPLVSDRANPELPRAGEALVAHGHVLADRELACWDRRSRWGISSPAARNC